VAKKCNILSTHLAQIDNSGDVIPCCLFKRKSSQWSDYNLKNLESFDKILNSKKWAEYRSRIQTEDIPECELCWIKEEAVNLSKRTQYNKNVPIKKTNPNTLQTLEVALDTTCNMMCRICQPSQSSKWASASGVIDELNNLHPMKNSRYSKQTIDTSNKDHFRRVFLNSDLTNLSRIRINGGEPFYSKNLLPVLYKIDKDAGLENVQLEFNTNGSIFPKKEILELLLKAKKLVIEFSIDAVGKLAEVTRYGESWKTIELTVEKWKTNFPNADFSLHTVISLLNLSQLNELRKWTDKIQIQWCWSFLLGPRHLSVYQLSQEDKNLLFKNMEDFPEKISLYDELMIQGPRYIQKHYGMFLKFTKTLDKYHSNSFEAVNPETYRLIEKLHNNNKIEWIINE
tara:strand:- start:2122 stop:3315 length:1194 start_codon:yes stop_codon:yes gene_type:complete